MYTASGRTQQLSTYLYLENIATCTAYCAISKTSPGNSLALPAFCKFQAFIFQVNITLFGDGLL